MNFANINHCWGSLIVEELARLGVEYFCVAPGSRSSPLVIAVSQNKRVQAQVHFDERGLAYHAMGYAASAKKPAVLISTSGTAAANFYPAVIEASKKKIPLIVITADRPPELRQTGAVQAIDQVGLFGKYTPWAVDMPCPDLKIAPEYVLTTVDQAWYQAVRHRGAVHINCMFRQPLTLAKTQDDLKGYMSPLDRWRRSQRPYTEYVTASPSLESSAAQEAAGRINAIKQGMIAVGKLAGEAEAKLVLSLAAKLGWPVFPDISSGLRLGQSHPNLIHYFDLLLLSGKLQGKLAFDGVLHFGGRMTSQRYYEFVQRQRPTEYIMVLNHALRNDPNHQVSLRIEAAPGDFIKSLSGRLKPRKASSAFKILSKAGHNAGKAIESALIKDGRLSEPLVARLVSQKIPKGQGLFLGNSMPVRDMANYADSGGSAVFVNGNRGASGIDGNIASAAGYARGLGRPVTLMLGDLAALHDVNSLSLLRDLPVPLVIVLLNNGGGAIFSFLPIAEFKEGFEKYWGTPHPYTFRGAAATFELNYSQPMDADHFKKVYAMALKSQTSTIIEVMTNRAENLKLHQALNQIVLDLI
jgi:2-succinyl-5-enolpyruvyl-6-hydroxy-3-cyclohexene-1-carboxylate synthase